MSKKNVIGANQMTLTGFIQNKQQLTTYQKFPVDEFVIGKLLRNYKNKSNNRIYRLVAINYERYSENTVHYFSYGQDLFNGL